jgi:hypothetical protein
VTAQFAAGGALSLRYLVVGKRTGIKLPAPRIAGPADNLWQQTCCEAFVASADGEPYGNSIFHLPRSGRSISSQRIANATTIFSHSQSRE